MEDNTILIAAEPTVGCRSVDDETGPEPYESLSGILAFHRQGTYLTISRRLMKNFPLSVAYPLSCLSFVFGMLGAMAFLGEQIPLGRWIGIGLILVGAALISR